MLGRRCCCTGTCLACATADKTPEVVTALFANGSCANCASYNLTGNPTFFQETTASGIITCEWRRSQAPAPCLDYSNLQLTIQYDTATDLSRIAVIWPSTVANNLGFRTGWDYSGKILCDGTPYDISSSRLPAPYPGCVVTASTCIVRFV